MVWQFLTFIILYGDSDKAISCGPNDKPVALWQYSDLTLKQTVTANEFICERLKLQWAWVNLIIICYELSHSELVSAGQHHPIPSPSGSKRERGVHCRGERHHTLQCQQLPNSVSVPHRVGSEHNIRSGDYEMKIGMMWNKNGNEMTCKYILDETLSYSAQWQWLKQYWSNLQG